VEKVDPVGSDEWSIGWILKTDHGDRELSVTGRNSTVENWRLRTAIKTNLNGR